jgi:glycosyltransferase involved in cell wall biosynthesis
MSNTFTDEEKQLLDNSVEFMEKCEKGILIDKDSCKFIDSPKISVIIPVYSASATIKKAIRSIQNQTLKEIEIILYDDASPDNSFNIMKELQEEDPRIKLYKNQNNRGVFYTRLSASKTAKGKYIMYLDNDDMFSRIDILNIVYGEIEKTGHDIIEFNGYSTHDYHLINKDKNIKSTSIYNKETEFTQPELSRVRIKKINENLVEINDSYLWGKIIKNDLMQKVINIIGEENYGKKMLYHDDDCVNYILFKNAKSFKYINVYGIFYYTNQESITHSKRPFQTCFDIINYFNFLFDHSDEDEKDNIAIRFTNEWDFKVTDGLNEDNTNYAKKVIKKFMECEAINADIKDKIKNICKIKF